VLEGFEDKFDIPLFSGETYTLYRQGGGVMLLLSYYIEYFPRKTVESEGYVFRACQYIDRHIGIQGFNVRDVANALKIDRSYLYRLFMEELNMSVMEYITDRRMAKAAILLANSTLSIKDIAYSAGYSDQMYFSRVFKQCNGQTPTAYRQGLFNGSDIPTKP
jgi:AraC-like DNA-binding protein